MMTTPRCRAVARRLTVRVLLAAFAAVVLMLFNRGSGHPVVHASPTTIADENLKVGADDWDISGAGASDIQGFATDISVNVGETVHFKIAAPGSAAFTIKIYRLGYYSGHGATLVDTVVPSASLPQVQPPCLTQLGTGLVDCGNWSESASWPVPATAVSGIYIAKLTRDTDHTSHIVFVVRDDARTADLVFQTSDTTWQAYNQYPGVTIGGGSLYCGGPLSNADTAYIQSCANRAAKVSYNRPFDTRAHDPQSFLFNAEYPMVRWLEANGYDVKYQSGVDTDRRSFDLTGLHKPKAFLSVGHDEYWSAGQRKAVENARNAGVNLAFLSGNEMYWKTRYEASLDQSATPYRTLVSYKETLANAKIDPAVDPITGVPIWTGTWRDPRFAAVSDGGQPENGLIGQIFTVNCCSDRIKIPQAMGGLRLWAHTGVSEVPAGDFYRTPLETLGYEWDEDLDNGSRPAGLVHLSSTTLVVAEKLTDFGAHVAQGTATHSLTLYRHTSGALVFGAGTVQWSWGLDGTHDRGDTASAHTPDQAMQQATVNLLADMDAQPATLQVGANPQRPLVTATKSADHQAPISSIVFPAAGASVPSGSRLTISGTSVDQGGGIVAGVEVSIDNGATWRAAQGTSLWNFDWTPGTPGSATIKVRAIDDSGSLESAGAGVTVIVAQGDCPCTSLFKPTTVPPVPDSADGNPYELGVKFKSDIDGFITGIRYYKSASNTGTHVGNLWLTNGTKLATATFAGETQSGWQEVLFTSPVPITAGTSYVASYHTNVGHYAATNDYFTTASVDSPPLHAPTSLIAAGNGVFIGGESAFPVTTFRDTNYWVDVVFSPTSSDTTAPAISNLGDTTIDSSKAVISWTTDEPASSVVEYSTDFTFPQAQTLRVTNAAFVTAHSLLIAGLRPNTTYYYRVTSVDAAGNATTSAAPSFTVPGPTLRDTAQADFLAGAGTGTYASETHDGELILSPAVGTEFSGTTMPDGWTEYAFGPDGYSAVGGGGLIVDGVRVAYSAPPGLCDADASGNCKPETLDTTPSAIFTAPHTVQFVATFTGDAFQHAGLGQTLGSAAEPWAIFSTMSGGALNARTNSGSGGAGAIDTFLGSGFVGAPHLFRIDWKAGSVDYYIDGNLVVSHPVAIVARMRPIAASDFNAFGGNVTVNWIRMSPYAASGVFESRIFDAESPVSWNTIQWQAPAPAGTSVAIGVRTGNTPTPDGSWSPFVPIASAGPLSLQSQFIQYRANLTSSNSDITPQLEDIIISTGHAPVANPDSAIVPQSGSHVFQASGASSLTANDTDADAGDILRVVGVTAPSHGSAILNADGSVTYTPTAAYSGPDAFTYTVSDGLLSSSATVSIDVRSGNIPPVATNDFYNVNEDSTLTVPAAIGVLANDSDFEHDPLSAILVTVPQHGALALGADGSFSYTPTANYAGSDAFQYAAFDGVDRSTPATVTIAIAQVNDAPSFTKGANQTVLEDAGPQTVLNWATAISAGAANESGQILSFTVTTTNPALFSAPPAVSSVGTLTYTPAANANGSATVSVVLHDDGGTASGGVDTSAPQSFTIAVTAVNDAPVAANASLKTDEDTAVSGALSATDVDGDALTYSIVANGAKGRAVITNAAKGAFTYTPNANANGSDSFTFVASDGVVKSNIATVSITIAPVNDAPAASNGSLSTSEDTAAKGTLSATDVDGDALTYSIVANGAKGTVAITNAATGAFTYTPNANVNGTDAFTFRASDGTLFSNTATVTVTITAVNDAPSFTKGADQTVLEDAGAQTRAAWATSIGGGPADESGQAIDFIVTSSNAGLFSTQPAVAANGTLTFTPAVNANGSAIVTVQAHDNGGVANGGVDTSAPQTFTITVTAVNDAPSFVKGGDQTAVQDSGAHTVAAWASAISAGPANESTQAVTFIVSNNNTALFSAQPTVSASGTLTYTSAAGVNGVATVTVSLKDNGGVANGGVDTSAAQTFTITITPPPTWVTSTTADFAAGTLDTGAYISQTGNGEVILKPTIASEFEGKTLDAGWTSTSLAAGGAATLGAGAISIDGASVTGGAPVGSGHSVEFSATFTGAAGQNAGLTASGSVSGPTYVVFGTKTTGAMLARLVIAGRTIETPIAGFIFAVPHKFRIDWTSLSVVYWIDDVKVATNNVAVIPSMKATALDLTVGDGALTIDYMRMTPYAASGSYTSRVFDAGAVVTWTTMSWTASAPAATTVALQYRTGNTPTPDATWTALTPVTASGGALAGSSRYAQFVAKETTTATTQTPVLNDVTLVFKR
jgi:VCBS repeat-containing protein